MIAVLKLYCRKAWEIMKIINDISILWIIIRLFELVATGDYLSDKIHLMIPDPKDIHQENVLTNYSTTVCLNLAGWYPIQKPKALLYRQLIPMELVMVFHRNKVVLKIQLRYRMYGRRQIWKYLVCQKINKDLNQVDQIPT